MTTISVAEFEEKVFEKEEIVIRIRAAAYEKVADFGYDRKAAGTQTVNDWKRGRIKPLVGEYQIAVIDGDCTRPHGLTKLATIRRSYER